MALSTSSDRTPRAKMAFSTISSRSFLKSLFKAAFIGRSHLRAPSRQLCVAPPILNHARQWSGVDLPQWTKARAANEPHTAFATGPALSNAPRDLDTKAQVRLTLAEHFVSATQSSQAGPSRRTGCRRIFS